MYVHKRTSELSVGDCRNLKQATIRARKIGGPLNTLVTFAPYPGSLPMPVARSVDLNRLLSHLRMWTLRHLGEPLIALWVWHSDVTGRNPHVHVFMHCPRRRHDELRDKLEAVYPEPNVIDVRDGSDIRRQHHSGYWGSTLNYLTRFKSQQAYWGDRGTWRASQIDANGRQRGIKAPITGKRWGCTRNLNRNAIDAYWEERPLTVNYPKTSARGTGIALEISSE